MVLTKTYTVNMHCPSCEMLLEGLEKLPGIEKIDADYRGQKLTVTFDDAVVTEEYVLAAVRKEDYDIQPAETSKPQSKDD